ncbi:MAG: SGNH/GDSL hydrolase family protein, partial [Acidimicrobiales bacterium]|nr:SGNH/GDSL hydrolase family protein [Acidimicrobiales bacterium]
VSAVILNATVVRSVGPGFLTIFPTGGNRPLASDVTFAGDETRPNLTVVQVGVGGKIDLYASTRADVIFDVAGWMS